MMTFDRSLYELYVRGDITQAKAQAIEHAAPKPTPCACCATARLAGTTRPRSTGLLKPARFIRLAGPAFIASLRFAH